MYEDGKSEEKKELTEVRKLSFVPVLLFWWWEGVVKFFPGKAGISATESLGEEGGECREKAKSVYGR